MTQQTINTSLANRNKVINTPSSPVGATWQYHEAENVPSGFEGPEKKLEIDFKYVSNVINNPRGLCIISGAEWQKDVLDKAQCTILSTTSNEYCNSYVLSESSLFVYPTKILLKTCGTTTLLNTIEPILRIADRVGLDVEFVFYSRKNFLFPTLQPAPHRNFDEEMKQLDRYFEGTGHVVGSLSQDHLYVYIADYRDDDNNDNNNNNNNSNQMDNSCMQLNKSSAEQKIEILMHDLNPNKMKQFFKTKDFICVEHTTKTSGIANILPGSTIDAFQFEPCGYSMNGLFGESYWTIHVTPEDNFSFVSFEANVSRDMLPCGNYSQLVQRVVDVFEPGRFTVALFADEGALPHGGVCELDMQWDHYHLNQQYSMDFGNGYSLTSCHWQHNNHPRVKKTRMRKVFSMQSVLSMDEECLSESSCEEQTNEMESISAVGALLLH